MTEENKIECPHCGEKTRIIVKSRIATFDEDVITYKCLNCEKTF